MMDFKEFTEKIKCLMTEHPNYLPKDFNDAKINIVVTNKNNDVNFTGLNVIKKNHNVGPVIYLDEFYEKYCHGEKDIDEVLRDISDSVVKHDLNVDISASDVMEYDRVKNRIIPRIVNFEWNKDNLDKIPHKKISDLVVTYHIIMDQISSVVATTPVKNAFMSEWGVNVDTLHEVAVKNMTERYPTTFHSVQQVLTNPFYDATDEREPDGFDAEDIMYILSNKIRLNGASAILDKKIMSRIVDKLGDDFIVIPSSIHEMILVKLDDDIDSEIIDQLIRLVNNNELSPDEKLSDHCYRYSVSEGIIV